MFYVIQVMTGEERDIMNLCRIHMDFSVIEDMFIPLYARKKKFKDEWKEVIKPLFPGYIFVDTEDIVTVNEELKKVEKFTKILKSADQVAPIAPEEERFLRTVMDESYVVRVSRGILIGQQVIVTDGVLKDVPGRITKINRHKRICNIEVKMFGRYTNVEVGLEVVKKYSLEEFEDWKRKTLAEALEKANAELRDELDKEEKSESKVAIEDENKAESESIGEGEKKADTYEISASDNVVKNGEKKYVRINSGIFKGLTGTLLEEGKDKVKVSIKVFDTPTAVEFKKDEVSYLYYV